MIAITLLAVFGIVFVMKESEIFDRPRIWLIHLHPIFYKLFDCYFCLGFWTSLVLYLITHLHLYNPMEHVLFGFAGATVSFAISSLIYTFQTKDQP